MESVIIREHAVSESVRWLDVGEYAGREVLRQWVQEPGQPARVIRRWWLEPVEEGR